MTTNDDHGSHFWLRSSASCCLAHVALHIVSKNFGFCNTLFKNLAIFPTFHAKRRLCDHVDGFLLQKFRSNFAVAPNRQNPHRACCMAYNPLHFRVVSVASNQQKRTDFVCFHSNFMDFCYKRAGSVMIRQAACVYFIIDSSGHAMTADDDLVPIGYGRRYRGRSQRLFLPGRLRPGRYGSAGQGSQLCVPLRQ